MAMSYKYVPITIEARQNDGSWATRNRFKFENEACLVGDPNWPRNKLRLHAYQYMIRWHTTYDDNRQLRINEGQPMLDKKPNKEPNRKPRAKQELCLACETNVLRQPIEGNNAYSRYCDAWICSKCGEKEAFEGFFWSIRAKSAGVKLHKGANYYDDTNS